MPMTPSEIEPATFRLVDQRINPLHHRATHSPRYNSWFMIQKTIGEELKICEVPEDMVCLLASSEVRNCSIYIDVTWYHLTEFNFAAFLKSQSSLSPKESPWTARIFRSVRKIAKRDQQFGHVCPFACPSAWNNASRKWTDFHEIRYLRIFRKSVEKIQVSVKSDKNKGCPIWRPIYFFL